MISLLENSYIRAASILIGALLFANILHFILRKYSPKLTQKTKTTLDDILVGLIIRPIYFITIFGGIYLAIKMLSLPEIYAPFIDGTFFAVIVLCVSFILVRILKIMVNRWLKHQKLFTKTPQVLNRMIAVTIYVLAVLMILAHFSIQITPLIAALGLGGLAIGLALQSTLANFFAGLQIISDRPVNAGDFIQLPDADISGYVEDVGWRSTRIKTLSNTIVVLPNAKLAESVIVNNSMPEAEMSIVLQCGVSYQSNLEKVEKVTVDVATMIQKKTPGAVKDFKPFIRYHTFADSNINFSVILRVEQFVDKYLVAHEFMKALKKRYDKEKIEISWPVRKVYYGK